MRKKIILVIGVMILISSFFVMADFEEPVSYKTNITLEKGWNLVSIYSLGPDYIFDEHSMTSYKNRENELEEKGINAVFLYDRNYKEYMQFYPNRDATKIVRFVNSLQEEDKREKNDKSKKEFWAFVSSSMWVYSNKKQRIEFEARNPPINLINLKSGWNFLSITPQMIGKNLGDIKGNCNIEKVYGWWSERQTWDLGDLGAIIPKDILGKGIIIKVSNDCNLGTGGNVVSPPSMP